MTTATGSSPRLEPRLAILRGLPYPWLALGTAALAAFLGPLEGNMVVISLPSLQRAFDVPAASIVWVMVAATLVTLGLTLPVGSLSERLGRRRLYVLGFWLFIAGAAAAFFAPNLPFLIGARVIQGLGTGLFASTRNAVAVEAMPGHRRGLAMGVILGAVGLGATTAPFLGGWLVSIFGWRAIFAAEIPVALIGGLAALAVLPPERAVDRQKRPFDLLGALFIFGAMGGILVAGNRLPSLGIASPLVVGLGLGGLVLLGAFIWREGKAPNPILDLSLMRHRAFAVPTATLALQMLSFATAANLLPFFLEGAMGLTPAQAGRVFAIEPFSLFLGSIAGGMLSDRLGIWRISVPTLGIMVLAFGGLLFLNEGSRIPLVLVMLCVIGLAEGAFQSTASAAQIAAVPPHRLGTAAAMFIAVIMLTISAGLTLGGTILTARLAVHKAALGDGPAAVAAAYHDVALVSAVFAVLAFAFFLAFARRRNQPTRD